MYNSVNLAALASHVLTPWWIEGASVWLTKNVFGALFPALNFSLLRERKTEENLTFTTNALNNSSHHLSHNSSGIQVEVIIPLYSKYRPTHPGKLMRLLG